MKRSSRSRPPAQQLVLRSFSPRIALTSPHLFAGRTQQITQLCVALHTPGSCILIYGPSGLGKTTLAHQISLIASGDTQLLARRQLSQWVVVRREQFHPIQVTLSKPTNLEGLVQLLINALLDIPQVKEDLGEIRLESLSRRMGFKNRYMEASDTRSFSVDPGLREFEHLSLEEVLSRLTKVVLSRARRKRLLLVIDEVDQLDSTGLSAFIRNLSAVKDDKTRLTSICFLLVGVAETVTDLLSDHAAMGRILVPVKVPRMDQTELSAILDNAERDLHSQGLAMTITREARDQLTGMAQGFPWFVHLLGQAAFSLAHDEGSQVVQESHIRRSITAQLTNPLEEEFDVHYRQLVAESASREILLRMFAEYNDRNIPVGYVYRRAKSAGINRPGRYKKDLIDCDGRHLVEVSTSSPRNRLVRFSNEMFKIYCGLRPPLNDGVGLRMSIADEGEIGW